MKRWIGTIFAAVSLLVCILACALWGFSYFRVCGFNAWWGSRSIGSTVRTGRIVTELYLEPNTLTVSGPAGFRSVVLPTNDEYQTRLQARHVWLGFGYGLPREEERLYQLGIRRTAAIKRVEDARRNPRLGKSSEDAALEVASLNPAAAIQFPCWSIVLLAAIAPALWWRGHRRRRRLALAGCCLNCGYDLRATPDRCPECGDVVSPRPAT